MDVLGIVFLHDFNLDSHHSLLQQDVSGGNLEIVLLGLTRRNHISLLEFHGFSSLLGKLSGNDDLASLRFFLVNGLSNDRGDGSSDGDLSKQFKLDGLSHSSGTESLLF